MSGILLLLLLPTIMQRRLSPARPQTHHQRNHLILDPEHSMADLLLKLSRALALARLLLEVEERLLIQEELHGKLE